MIQIDLAWLGFPCHMTYTSLGLVPNLHISTFTQILENMNRSALPESTVLHLPMPLLVDSQDGYTLLSPCPMSQCVVVFSHNGVAEVLSLPEYVASTAKSRTHNKPTTNSP